MVFSLVDSSEQRINLIRNNGLLGSHHFGLIEGICVGGSVGGADGGKGARGRKQGVVDETFGKMETCDLQQVT